MLAWSQEEAVAYFESGGTVEPASVVEPEPVAAAAPIEHVTQDGPSPSEVKALQEQVQVHTHVLNPGAC